MRFNKIHGMSRTRFYRIWNCMLTRCNYPQNNNYLYYGAKGIKVLWKSFNNFKEDMYASYLLHISLHGEKNTTIERINGNGYYSKQNCRWATLREQNRNRKNNRYLKDNKEKLCFNDMALKYNIKATTLQSRLSRGWPLKTALIIPIYMYNKLPKNLKLSLK